MDRNRLISIGIGFASLACLVGLDVLRSRIGVEVHAAGSAFFGLVLWQSQKLIGTGSTSKEAPKEPPQ